MTINSLLENGPFLKTEGYIGMHEPIVKEDGLFLDLNCISKSEHDRPIKNFALYDEYEMYAFTYTLEEALKHGRRYYSEKEEMLALIPGFA